MIRCKQFISATLGVLYQEGCVENMYNKMDQIKELNKLERRNALENRRYEMELKSRNISLRRRLNEERQETVLEEKLAGAIESQEWTVNELAQEEDLAYHLDESRREEICKEKERQQLWQFDELVSLKNSLKNAYFTKSLHSQLAEAEAIKAKNKCEDEEYKMKLQKEILDYEREKEELKRRKLLADRQYRNDLQNQIVTCERKKMEEKEIVAFEKQAMHDIVQSTNEEDKIVEEESRKKRESMKAEQEAFFETKRAWALREKEKEEEENKKIQQYLCHKLAFEKTIEETNRKKNEERAAAREKLVDRIHQMKAGREERERIAQILCDEETKLREESEARKKKEESLRRYLEMKETVQGLLKEKLARAEEEKKMNLLYQEKLEEEIESARREEREEAERRRMKKEQYREDLRVGLEQMYKNKAHDKFQVAVEYATIEKEKKELREKIDEERRRIINEHAPQLYGYLPKSLVSQEDLPHLKPHVREYFDSKRE